MRFASINLPSNYGNPQHTMTDTNHKPQFVDALRRLHHICMDSLAFAPALDSRLRRIFLRGDRRGFGALDGETARRLFRTSGLPDAVLFEIWNVADINQRGELDYRTFSLCCALIAYCQKHPDLVSRDDWLWHPQLPKRLCATTSSADGGPALDLSVLESPQHDERPLITPMEAVSYEKLFLAMDRDSDGFLDGAHVRDYYLMRNELGDEELSRIWEMADADGDGRLTLDEFMIMEHMVQTAVCHATSVTAPLPHTASRAASDQDPQGPRHLGTESKPVLRLAPDNPLLSASSSQTDMHGTKAHPEEINGGSRNGIPAGFEAAANSTALTGDSNRLDTVTTFPPPNHPEVMHYTGPAAAEEARQLRAHVASLKSHVQDLEADLARLAAENTQLRALYKTNGERASRLNSLRHTYSSELDEEMARLRAEERELHQLQDQLKAMRRDKLAAQAEQQALREALRHSEDAEQTMLRSLRGERDRLVAARGDRLQTARKKIDLLEALRQSCASGRDSKVTIRAINDSGAVRDSKGIRMAAVDGGMERRLNPLTGSLNASDWSQREGEAFPR